MRKFIRLSIIALTLMLIVTQCFGWGEDGHRIIGEIAWRHLTEKAKAGVKDLLGEQSLADAGLWADIIKGDPTYDFAKPLHYVNMPRDATQYSKARDCSEGVCVVEAINKYIGVLKDETAPRPVQIEALKFLVHFVEDIHQPLHAAYGDDRGGNSIRVKFFGGDTNLHRVWDSDLLSHMMKEGWLKHAEQLILRISDADEQSWASTINPADMANESFALARKQVYEGIPMDNAIGEAYLAANRSAVDEQLSKAGIRLAAILNDIFESWTPPPPPPLPPQFGETPQQPVDPASSSPVIADPSAISPPPAGGNGNAGPGFGGGEPAPVITGDAAAMVSIVKGDACGNADGREVFVLNADIERTVRVKVVKTMTFAGKAQKDEDTVLVKPGEAERKLLGCSAAKVRQSGTRTIEWVIVHADFVAAK